MSSLALGTAQFGLNYGIANQHGRVSYNETKAILKYARASGMVTLDTAVVYGASEQRLGEIGIQDWQVVSKLPAISDDCGDIAQWVANAVEDSLERLKVSSLYGLLLHRPQQLLETKGKNLYQTLQRLKDDGLVQKVGVSIYDPEELDNLCSRYQFDLVQAPFNLIDGRLINIGWMSRLAKQGIELHVRSVFLQGLLLMNASSRPNKFDRWALLWARYDDWLKQMALTPMQACIRHALSFVEISKVIVGVNSRNQLDEILQASEGPMPPVPVELQSNDVDLLNPARWAAAL